MTIPAVDRPSRRVLLQRVRNRLIEYLEVAASFEQQRFYQERVPHLHVPDEVINQWADWVSEDWEAQLTEPVFSAEERAAIARFYAVWTDVTGRLPEPLPGLDAMFMRPEWELLRQGAAALFVVFSKRGKLSEDQEQG